MIPACRHEVERENSVKEMVKVQLVRSVEIK